MSGNTNPWTIRSCTVHDAEALLALWRQAEASPSVTDTVEDVTRAIATPAARVLVALVDAQIVGSIIGTFDGWRGNIYRMAVSPEWRRRGVGRALVTEIENWLNQQGARRITVLVEKERFWAARFWQAVGYPLDEHIERHARNLG